MAKPRSLFLDGRMVRADQALMDALEPGVVAGKGVFETMRASAGEVLNLDEHLTRLLKGLKTLKMRAPYSRKQFKQYLSRVIRANKLKKARIRLAVWKEGRLLRTAIVGQAFTGYSEEKYKKGFTACLSKVCRPKTRFSYIKSMDYGIFRQAFIEAQANKCDEAILLNNRGRLVEGSRTNIFFVKRGVLCTPATRCGCLNGITRRNTFHLARQLGIPCKAVEVGLRALRGADEAFLTNALMDIMPLTRVGGKTIGQKGAGPITKKLMDAFNTNIHSTCPLRTKSV